MGPRYDSADSALHGRNFRFVKFSKKLEAEPLELFGPRDYVNKEDESKSLFLQRA
jgi:hypothetical protein